MKSPLDNLGQLSLQSLFRAHFVTGVRAFCVTRFEKRLRTQDRNDLEKEGFVLKKKVDRISLNFIKM